jgi:hypothetical protein
MNELYQRIDGLLEQRARDFPRRVEPLFGTLQASIRELATRLREAAGRVAPAHPPAELVAAPVFVCGYYRSGTTLMAGLLQGHPDVVSLPSESRYFGQWRRRLASLPEDEMLADLHDGWIRRAVSPDGLPPFWSLGRPWEDGGDRYAAFTRALFAYTAGREPGDDLLGIVAAAFAQGSNPRLWAEKTPTNELHVPEIVAAYQNARFVHMVRDPRATLASIKAWNRGQHLVSVPAAAVELRKSLEAARTNVERSGADRYLIVRYESLVTEPEREMRRVASFLGLEWSDVLVTPSTTANSSNAERRVQGRIHGLSETASAGRIGDAVVAALAAEPARAFGYDLPGGSAPVALATRGYLSVTARAGRALARVRARARRPSLPS